MRFGLEAVIFERFTERARQVVVLAQEEARQGKNEVIGLPHVFVGVMLENEGAAARVLGSMDISLSEAHAARRAWLPDGENLASGQIPFTPIAKKTLELALREALGLGHNYIGTEHILLGIIREVTGAAPGTSENGTIVALLNAHGGVMKVRNEVIRVLSGSGAQREVARRDRAERATKRSNPDSGIELAATVETAASLLRFVSNRLRDGGVR